jgi:hypothetical protein
MGKGGGGVGGIAKKYVSVVSGAETLKAGQGLYNKFSGVDAQARAAQQAAEAEAAARGAVTTEAVAARERYNLAAQSPQQLAALEKSLAAAQTQVDTDLRQLAAIDPAIMEASKQVMTLLQGGKAAVNDPMMQQRNQQRQQLVDSLRAQYGPGAESSSIGQRALQQFDMQSNTAFQQNQQNTLGNLFGMATTRVQGQGFGQMMNVGQGFGDYQNRILGAETMGSQGILNAMNGQAQSAGAPFVGDSIRAGGQRQLFDMAIRGGMAYATGGGSEIAGAASGGKGGGGSAASKVNPAAQMQTNSYFGGTNPYE